MDNADAQIRADLDEVEQIHKQASDLMLRLAQTAERIVDKGRNDGTVTPSILGLSLFTLKGAHEQLDALVKQLYHCHDSINKHILPERLRANDMDGFRLPEIARSFSIVEKTSASMLDKEKGLDWLRSIGQGDIIQETVNAGTLAAFCRNLVLEQGIDPPPNIIKMSTYSTMSMVKYRPK